MLNTVSQVHSDFGGGRPRPGVRFIGTGVNIVTAPHNPIRTWIINDDVNPVVTIQSSDLGLLLHPTLVLDPSHPPVPRHSPFPAPSLQTSSRSRRSGGVKDTPRRTSTDKGAKTLRNAVAHYQRSFNFTDAQDLVGSRSLGGLITLTDNDVGDIVAYLKLLGPNRIDK